MSFSAKSVIFDIASNWGSTGYISINVVEFKYGGSLILNSSPTVYATSYYSAEYHPMFAFDTDVDKNESWGPNCSWVTSTGSITNQRVIVVFDSLTTFDQIIINNGHLGGSMSDTGAKEVKIYVSTDEITDTTYNASISNSTLIFDGDFNKHIAADQIDDWEVVLSSPTSIAKLLSIVKPTRVIQ